MPPFSIGARECLKGVRIAFMMSIRKIKCGWAQTNSANPPG